MDTYGLSIARIADSGASGEAELCLRLLGFDSTPAPQGTPRAAGEGVVHARALEDLPLGGGVSDVPLLEGEILEILDARDKDWWYGETLRGERGLLPSAAVRVLEEPLSAAELAEGASVIPRRAIDDGSLSQAAADPLLFHDSARVVDLEEYLEVALNRLERGRLVVSTSFEADGRPIQGSHRVADAMKGKVLTASVRLAQELERDLSYQYKKEPLLVNGGRQLRYDSAAPQRSGVLAWASKFWQS